MAERILPRYPIYIPSRSRFETAYTARLLMRDGIDFKLIVEAQELDEYAVRFGEERCLVLPESNQGLIYARNWIKAHSIEAGARRHWQLDDNITHFYRRWERTRIHCNAGNALACCEDFSDRFENVAISGLNYYMFVPDQNTVKPWQLNCHVYSCSLINNEIPHRWRLPLNDDTDICLQVLADGWCTILINVFLAQKIRTMIVKGGNTSIYEQQDGRLKMSRSLERLWPGVVQTSRRFGRPQHSINWAKFDQPLRRRADAIVTSESNEYGLKLIQVKEIKSAELRKQVDEVFKRENDEKRIKSANDGDSGSDGR